MPCYCPPEPPSREETLAHKMPAVLCAALRRIAVDDFVKTIDWSEAGVTEAEFREWYRLHAKRDAERRREERYLREREQKQAEALAKLTPDERKLLGLK